MKAITARELARTMVHGPRGIPMVVNGWGVQAVEVAHGRLRRDVMGVSFSEMPDKPRDAALVLRFTDCEPMTLAQVQAVFEEHGDLEVFVWGTPVSAIRYVETYYDHEKRRHVFCRGTHEMVSTPLHWTELSDGTRDETYIWTKPAPTPTHSIEE